MEERLGRLLDEATAAQLAAMESEGMAAVAVAAETELLLPPLLVQYCHPPPRPKSSLEPPWGGGVEYDPGYTPRF